MKKIPMIASAIIGVIAVVIFWYWSSEFKKLHSAGETERVIIAKKNLNPNVRIKKEKLGYKKIPKRYLHAYAIPSKDIDMVINQVPTYKIKAGQPLLWTDFRDGTAGKKQLSKLIKKGERVYTIHVDRISSAGGNLMPGDHVDILGIFKKPNESNESTITLLQDVVVLATGSDVGGSIGSNFGGKKKRQFSTVSLKVTIEESELLAFAQHNGKLTLAIRNPEDVETFENVPEKTFSDIFETKKRKIIQKKRDKITEIKNY